MPKVSIIIPAYNAQETVMRCLESIRSQSYGDFEVICVDDGSADRTGALIDEFCATDGRFSCIHRENAGAAGARNAGLDAARGEFVTFVDADDVLPANALRFMHQTSVIRECDTIMGMYERVDGVTPYTNARSSHLVNTRCRVEQDNLDVVHTWALWNKWFSRAIIEDNSLRFEPYTHLEDAVFVYSYLRLARRIYTCPHVVYTYIKPLPAFGRTTTQNVSEQLLESAERALGRLKGLTADYGSRFALELDYRFLNSPLVGDYFRRFWSLSPTCAAAVHSRAEGLFAQLPDRKRETLVRANFDLFDAHGPKPVSDLVKHQVATIAVGPGVSADCARKLLDGLFDQSFVSFRAIVDARHGSGIGKRLPQTPNLELSDDPFTAALATESPFVAFIDCDMMFDHRALMTMAARLVEKEELDFVALQPKSPSGHLAFPNKTIEKAYGTGDMSRDRFLANKLFRKSSLAGKRLDMPSLFSSLSYEALCKPAMVSFMPEEAFDPDAPRIREERERAQRRADLPKRARRKVGRLLRKVGLRPAPAPPRRKTLDFYLDEEVDRHLIVLEGLGKCPKGNMLYLLRELQKPQYEGFRVAFSVTEESLATSTAIVEREGFGNVELVIAGSDAYKTALFTAGFLFNEVDFPNWWIKKPRQVYVNIWHGTPLKTLAKAKTGIVHMDANGARNFTMADYLLFPNDHTRRHLLGDYDVAPLAGGTALMLGYPRTAQLFDGAARHAMREAMGLDTCHVVAWMPTYRDWMNAERAAAFLDEMDDALGDGELLFVNLHHKTEAEIDFKGYRHVRRFPMTCDTYEFLNAADTLVTDYSSVLFDFAVTRRRIVLHCPDLEAYCAERGLYMNPSDLPFPTTRTAAELTRTLRSADGGFDDDYAAFNREFNAFDSANNTQLLCETTILGRADAVESDVPRLGRFTLIVSDGLQPGPATELLHSLNAKGWPEATYLSFLEQEVDADTSAAYPLVREVPIFATKGNQLSERTEQQRLYGDLPFERVIVVDTESAARIRAFARFYLPTYLFLQDAVVDRIANGDTETAEAVKLFARWGQGLFAYSEKTASAAREALGIEVETISSAEALTARFFGHASPNGDSAQA